ncbi:MAG: Adenine DNA glycosylase [Alphaproteobacteria bacterium MarineAlpha9_Bin3]|nr:MAG: Adenine DNA glycosylase [Alphaproteobacteria bacterium MarineAlpha9_Bin3]
MDTNEIILNWYDSEKRNLPWREPDKNKIDVYKVWISEIMLQQTTVMAVIPYFKKFITRFPNINILAESDIEEVLTYWAGLGYYSRARNLHECSKQIIEKFNGVFPREEEILIKLPGIGDYTASAICAIAYNQHKVALDVNVKRVISRINNKHNLCNISIKKLAINILSEDRPGDFNEAIMDIGSKYCKSKFPKCSICPINKICKTFKYNKNALIEINKKKPIKEKIIKYGNCYLIKRKDDNKFLFIRRPSKGLLGGMLSFPSSLWVIDKKNIPTSKLFDDLITNDSIKGPIHHTFSHFNLILNVYNIKIIDRIDIEGEWIDLNKAKGQLPSLMKKVANLV